MKNIAEIAKMRENLLYIEQNRIALEEFVKSALSRMTLARASGLTGLNISKLSRGISGKNPLDLDDIILCFLKLTEKIK